MKQSIGILGFGIVGKSALQLVTTHWHKIINVKPMVYVWDQRTLSDDEYTLIKKAGAQIADTGITLGDFVQQHNVLIPSPGIDLSSVAIPITTKIIDELDLFTKLYQGRSLAITGTLGKTSITSLLGQLLTNAHKQGMTAHAPIVAGNIGTSMLDLLQEPNQHPLTILELSSFQLERSASFAPDVAILTSFYPNHLDRHQTLNQYFRAKQNLFMQQGPHQHAILPIQLFHDYPALFKQLVSSIRSSITVTSPTPICTSTIDELTSLGIAPEKILTMQSTGLLYADVPRLTFDENWLTIIATLITQKCSMEQIKILITSLHDAAPEMSEHRVEFVGHINGCAFYNDSKSTIMQATQAAVNRLAQQYDNITLILGGTDKGIDRTAWIQELMCHPHIKKIYWLGNTQPNQTNIPAYDNLNTLCDMLVREIRPGEAVLFSPSGASYDLFKHYVHRGVTFKKIVTELATKHS